MRSAETPNLTRVVDNMARMDDLEATWDELIAATPAGWYVGRPSYRHERQEWLMYAIDPSERPAVGIRKREWQAVGDSEVAVVREMARCLREIVAGRVPK